MASCLLVGHLANPVVGGHCGVSKQDTHRVAKSLGIPWRLVVTTKLLWVVVSIAKMTLGRVAAQRFTQTRLITTDGLAIATMRATSAKFGKLLLRCVSNVNQLANPVVGRKRVGMAR